MDPQINYQKHYQVTNDHRSTLKFIPYVGCKAGFKEIFNDIIDDRFVGKRIYDIFGGGGSFSFYASSRFGSDKVIYNDNNPTLVNLLRCLQRNPYELWTGYMDHYHKSSDSHYYEVRNGNIEVGIEGAVNFFYLCKNAFSGKIRFNSKGRFNTSIRKGSKCPKVSWDKINFLSEIIKDMTITNYDYQHYNYLSDGLIYLDPPYMNNTNGHYNGVPKLFEFNSFLRSIEKNNAVILSEQNSPDIFDLPGTYRVKTIVLNRSLQYETKKMSEEIIAFNY